jgi:hypothetical protein
MVRRSPASPRISCDLQVRSSPPASQRSSPAIPSAVLLRVGRLRDARGCERSDRSETSEETAHPELAPPWFSTTYVHNHDTSVSVVLGDQSR